MPEKPETNVMHRIHDDLYGHDLHPDFLLALEDELVDELGKLCQVYADFTEQHGAWR